MRKGMAKVLKAAEKAADRAPSRPASKIGRAHV
jgi:hypothetical protein